MCKHILVNDFKIKDLDVIKEFASKTSDKDGFGAILRYSDGSLDYLKSLSIASFYVELTKKILLREVQTLVVHHRTSTNGDGLAYAHPFEYAGNYMTHNGVVTVPGKHEVKTTNDSEALLHHLIKTGYETKSISGYFSCFVLNPSETVVLVDSLAPIYTNGRIYCSHKMGEDFRAIELMKITLNPVTGAVIDAIEIQVTENDYGVIYMDKSLGYNNRYATQYSSSGYTPHGQEEWYDPYSKTQTDKIESFLDMLTTEEEKYLFNTTSKNKVRKKVFELNRTLGLEMSKEEIRAVVEFIAA